MSKDYGISKSRSLTISLNNKTVGRRKINYYFICMPRGSTFGIGAVISVNNTMCGYTCDPKLKQIFGKISIYYFMKLLIEFKLTEAKAIPTCNISC